MLLTEYCNDYIVVSAFDYRNEIYSFLLDIGVPEHQILSPFYGVYENQYFIPEVKLQYDEVFIDAGCYNGKTILDFMKFCGGKFKKICGFEPDSLNYAQTVSNFISQENIVIYNKGIWSSDTELLFHARNTGTSHINQNGQSKIPVVSIDSVAADESVTFIKMDIEGAELEALHGAGNTIVKNKPKLAICIYHKYEDVLTIPLYILQFVPDYKFYIRHHSYGTIETVLYAIPE